MFGQPGPGNYILGYGALGVNPVDLSALERSVSDMPSDRAPGPDGFTDCFYKSAWPVIKNDVVAALNTLLFGDSRAFSKLNNEFVVLLPKKLDAATPVDYRPITMIHSFGKLVSKLLAT